MKAMNWILRLGSPGLCWQPPDSLPTVGCNSTGRSYSGCNASLFRLITLLNKKHLHGPKQNQLPNHQRVLRKETIIRITLRQREKSTAIEPPTLGDLVPRHLSKAYLIALLKIK